MLATILTTRRAGILVGENKMVGMVVNSQQWLRQLIDLITQAQQNEESIWITVV